MTSPEDIKMWIEAGMNNAQAKVEGDGHHFDAVIISPDFVGKNTLVRHRMVYEALGDKMDSAIHALSMKTLTPDQLK